MKKKLIADFVKTESPISQPVTKFGGQPNWIEKSEWAVSRSSGKPMMFICQIALEEEIFGNTGSKMAYIFMTDFLTDNFDSFDDGSWEPDGGENAVFIQPGGNNPPFIAIENGPTLRLLKGSEFSVRQTPVSLEYSVQQSEIVEDSELEGADTNYIENKIGGIPRFIQPNQYPSPSKDDWDLLLQLDSVSLPFEIDFGDGGVSYAFISKDRKTGKFLWQSC